MKNFLTYGKLDWECLHRAQLGDNDVNPSVRQQIVNSKIYKIYGLLDGVNHPRWNRTITLTVAADQEYLLDQATNGGTITAINHLNRTITRSSGSFPLGALLDIIMVTKATGIMAGQWKARVTVGGATATYDLISGSEGTFQSSTQVCFVNVMKKLSLNSGDVSTQYVKSVVKVYDDQASGNKERVFDHYVDPRKFGLLHKDPFHNGDASQLGSGRVGWYHQGETIYLDVGMYALGLGIVQAEVVAKPALYTDATAANEVDTPPEENEMLIDEVVAEFLKTAGQPVPDKLAEKLALYQKRYESAAADRAKALEIRQGVKA